MNNDKPGSILGGVLLIAGSCIGAGMLALPILTGLAGFFPSLIIFLSAWAFMTLTGLLLVEANGWFTHQVNLISMAGHALGWLGRVACWVLYLFLFYALLIAYVSGSGNLFSTFFEATFSARLPDWIGSLFFVILFGWVVYLGTRKVDMWNRLLMFGKIACFFGLIALGFEHVRGDLLLRTDANYAIFSLPVLVISFGFHNMIPSLTAYMRGDLRRVKLSIIGGSFFTLFIYILWEIIVLGIIPLQGDAGIIQSLKNDKEASQAIAKILGLSWVSNFAQGLAFFAILTSFLAQSLSLVHFLADGFKIPVKNRENLGLCALALIPPLVLSVVYPQLFFKALNFAGGICAVILFGIMPAAMVWIGRYRKEAYSAYQIFGGRLLLIAVILFSLFILFFQISNMAGASYIPKP